MNGEDWRVEGNILPHNNPHKEAAGGVKDLDDLREKLAEAEHDSWSSWMQWLYKHGYWNEDGSFTIQSDKAERWLELSVTLYKHLDEPTKRFDRDEVKKIAPLISEAIDYVTPERKSTLEDLDGFKYQGYVGFNQAIDHIEAKKKEILGEDYDK